MSRMNRMGNARNPYQGDFPRVLCVCSAGLLRSPTAALVLAQEPFNFNTRAAGVALEYALIPVDEVLLSWAEMVVFMQAEHHCAVRDNPELSPFLEGKTIIVLDIPDKYEYRHPELIELIRTRMAAALEEQAK